ncbi:4-hydroxy-2-oxovalerate aldolase [Kitasatospora sp. NPDC097605]|uniref:4-hydroxy-2-oxovalerate aldolase n=1 Tax=Kitasatospora sp. NPDC097605 TaxID=3157226 RepID=UPI00331A14DE
MILHDATLRDGQHSVGHRLDAGQLRAYAEAANAARVPLVEVGHGNGLGGSSLQIGQALLEDRAMIEAVRDVLTHSRLGVFVAPGWGTGHDIRDAVRAGADVVRVAAHCTLGDTTERHLALVRDLGAEAQAVLLMSHMADPGRLAEECARMVAFGAQAVGIMDSAGHYTMRDVTERIGTIAAAVDVPVIFHGHNNLALAVANSLAAVQAGASVIDACARGFGAGAGNTQLEALVPVLEREGHTTGVDLHAVLRAADTAEARLLENGAPTTDSAGIMSGLAGVFSAFRLPVLRAAAEAGVDPLAVFTELGRRGAVAGQEDLIPEVVRHLAKAAA